MTERLYILGHPVSHSKSPAMHNAAYRALGLSWEYGFKDCATQANAQVFLNVRNWRGCNVTMPWKQIAYRSAEIRTAEADLAQGANTLVNWGGRVCADNTDGKGFVAYLQRCGVSFDGARVAVCGTGPTSLAIAHSCLASGAQSVRLFGRDLDKTRSIASDYSARLEKTAAGTQLEACAYGVDDEKIADADVVVDATPLGMNAGDPAPFDTAALSAGQTVFDVVYGHGETSLLRDARSVGCTSLDGSGMLVAQAVEAVRFFAKTTEAFSIPAHLDLFSVMADAAGFDLS